MATPSTSDAAIDRVLSLFAAQGAADYVGEAVSQLEHATQCGACAADAGADDAVVIGALLHDVGHMLGLEAAAGLAPAGAPHVERMGDFGVVNHEGLGSRFLGSLGFPPRVLAVVSGHVAAKRYLCWKNAAYHAKLSEASAATLVYQGGPMTAAEAAAFEADPLQSVLLKMRTWDEAAKVVGRAVPPLEAYVPRMRALLEAGGSA